MQDPHESNFRKTMMLASFLLLISVTVVTQGCAKRQEGPSSEYLAMLEAYKQIAEIESKVDRRNLVITVGAEPVVLPAGMTIEARVVPPPLQVPGQHRDYAYEAELARDTAIISMVAGPLASGFFGYLGQRENRKMITGMLENMGGPTFTATDGSEINFSGGWGDRTTGTHTGDYSEASPQISTSTESTVTTNTASISSNSISDSGNPSFSDNSNQNNPQSTDNSNQNNPQSTDNSNQNNPTNPDPIIVPAPDPVIVPAPDPVIVDPVIVDPVIVSPTN